MNRRKYSSRKVISNIFDFSGYASRSEFSLLLILPTVIGAAFAICSLMPMLEYLPILFSVICVIPLFSLTMRRFHAVGISRLIAVALILFPLVLSATAVDSEWKFFGGSLCLMLIEIIGLTP